MFKVRNHDHDLQRKGRVLALILLGLMVVTVVLAVLNVVNGDTQYYIVNGAFISLLLGLYTLNRFGFVRAAGVFVVLLTIAGPFAIFDNLVAMHMTMSIPILIASSLLTPWSGFVVAALMIGGTAVFGVASLSLLILVIIAFFSYIFADSLDRAYRENRYRALHDELTDLPNRTQFADCLQQAIDSSGRDRNLRAVLFMDLDQFKVVNDSLGHEFGDELLIAVAQRLRSCLRPGDVAARFGGDEFAILLDGVADVNDVVRVTERIVEELQAPFELRERRIFISTSIGIALSEDTDAQPNALLHSADIAMYEAKKEGKGCYEVFSSEMYTRALRRLEMENGLRQAIERGELRVHYQPKVSLSTGRIAGMEALVRWEHPERGLIFPEEFILLAEETGLIFPLGRWVLRETCRQAREWQKQYPTAPPLAMSVNLSVKQFREPNLVWEIAEALRETGLDPRRLQLEVTESVVVDNVEYVVDLLQELKGLGVRLAMDDFGTGYSSLVALQQFPLDDLKVDKVFVGGLGKDAQEAVIVQLVIDLARAMGLRAVAEGVETAEQLVWLRDMGCDQAQGNYLCEPLVAEAVAALLADPSRLIYQHHLMEHPRSPSTLLEGRHSDPK